MVAKYSLNDLFIYFFSFAFVVFLHKLSFELIVFLAQISAVSVKFKSVKAEVLLTRKLIHVHVANSFLYK